MKRILTNSNGGTPNGQELLEELAVTPSHELRDEDIRFIQDCLRHSYALSEAQINRLCQIKHSLKRRRAKSA